MKILRIVVAITLIFCLTASLAMAQDTGTGEQQEGVSSARQIWAKVWTVINFLILAGVIFKFGRKPLLDFLKAQAAERSENLEQSMELKKKAQEEYQEAVARLEQMQETIKEVETYMMEDAERQRQLIMQQAEEMSKQIIADANDLAMNTLIRTQTAVKRELAETVVVEAEKLIRQHIAQDDQDKMIDEYMGSLSRMSQAG